MTNLYNWKIHEMATMPTENNLTKVVKSCVWVASALLIDNDKIFAEMSGEIEFTNPNPSNFVQYNNLTEQTVLNWVYSADPNLKNLVENELDARIQHQLKILNGPIIYKNPWDTVET